MTAPTFSIGDRVWLASYAHAAQVQVPCPVCFGKCIVTLILGNGDECRLPCGYCRNGYDGPRGYVIEHAPIASATEHTIDTVTTTSLVVEYGADGRTLYSANTFATEAEALARGAEIAAEERQRVEQRAGYMKHDAKRSFAWNAGYHLREAKDLRRRIEHHEQAAVLCKAKSKEQA